MISEGSVDYSNTTDSSLRNKVAEQINNDFTDFNDITLEYLLIATWKDVTIGDGKVLYIMNTHTHTHTHTYN